MPATPKVFISATSQDLGRYRQAVSHALVTKDVMPVDQEHTVPDFRTIADILRKRIQGCDAVICLLGRVYGREPLDRPPGAARRSYTQMEYDIALDLGLPVFRFVATDDCPVDAAADEPEELRALQREHLKRLTGTDHIWTPFRSVEELAAQIGLMRFDRQSLQAGIIRRLAVVLVAEMLDASAQRHRLGEEAWIRGLLRPYQDLVRKAVAQWRGSLESETPSDCLVNFETADAAVSAALDLHLAVRRWTWQAEPPAVRVGIHLGQIVQFGGVDESRTLQASLAVETCRRLTSLAEPGQTLLTQAAFDNARQFVPARWAGSAADAQGAELPLLSWLSHGRYVADGPAEPVEVCEVGLPGLAPLRAPAGSAQFHRADSFEEQQMRGWRPSIDQPIPRKEDWIIEAKLGEGGFGEVWLAQHRRLKERRVFKFCFDPERLRSFKRELTFFRLIKQHLGDRDDIARLLDISTDEPPYYLESEYVDAGNLADWAERQGGIEQVPFEQRLQLLAEIAVAVAAAHSLGIIHKDLKPSNVFIVPRNGVPHPRLADFGVGALADRTLLAKYHVTETGFSETFAAGSSSSGYGTRLYAPPETLEGKPATTAGDVYALGVMLYQLAVGNLKRSLGIGWEEGVADELLRDDIRACTYGDPARRLAGAAELAQRLAQRERRRADRDALRRAEEQARQASLRAERQAERARRLRQWTIAAAVALVALAGLAVFSVAQWRLAERRRLEADESRYAAEMRLAHKAATDGDMARATSLLDEFRALADGVDFRGFEWRYLWRLCEGDSRATYRGFADQVSCVAFSPDGKTLAAGSLDSTVRVFDAATREPPKILHLDGPGVLSLAFSPDGRSLACTTGNWSLTRAGSLCFCDWRAGRVESTVPAHLDGIDSVAFSRDGRYLATCSEDNTTILWRVTGPHDVVRETRFAGHNRGVNALAFTPDSRHLAAASGDGYLQVWEVDSKRPLIDQRAQVSGILSLAFAPDNKTLLVGSRDGPIMFWDIVQRRALDDLDSGQGQVNALAVSADGRQFASAGSDSSIAVWDLAGRRLLTRLCGHRGRVLAVAFSPLGHVLASGSDDRTVKLWDPTRKREVPTLPYGAAVSAVAFTRPDGQFLAVAGGALAEREPPSTAANASRPPKEIRLWKIGAAAAPEVLGTHDDVINSLAFSPDGGVLASGCQDSTVALWDVAARQRKATLRGHSASVLAVRFSPDGSLLATGSRDKTINLWDARDAAATPLATLRDHQQPVYAVAFSPDGKLMASAGADRAVRVWDTTTRAAVAVLGGFNGACMSVEFSPDGRLLAAGSADRTLRLWDTASGKPPFAPWARLFGYKSALTSVSFSPDGRTLAAGGGDGSIILWSVATKGEVAAFAGHRGGVSCLAFAPGGNILATGSNDQTVKLWYAATGLDPPDASSMPAGWLEP